MKTLVSFDPPYTPGMIVGIIAAKGTPERVTVMEDATIAHVDPLEAAKHTALVAQRNAATGLVVESRGVMDLAREALRRVSDLPVQVWRVDRSLRARVERMDAAHSRGMIEYAGDFPMLQEELRMATERGAPRDRLEAMLLAIEPILFPVISARRL